MSVKVLSREQKAEALKQEWLKEAEPYLADRTAQKNGFQLDGKDSAALARLQEKYKAEMRKLKNSERVI